MRHSLSAQTWWFFGLVTIQGAEEHPNLWGISELWISAALALGGK